MVCVLIMHSGSLKMHSASSGELAKQSPTIAQRNTTPDSNKNLAAMYTAFLRKGYLIWKTQVFRLRLLLYRQQSLPLCP